MRSKKQKISFSTEKKTDSTKTVDQQSEIELVKKIALISARTENFRKPAVPPLTKFYSF